MSARLNNSRSEPVTDQLCTRRTDPRLLLMPSPYSPASIWLLYKLEAVTTRARAQNHKDKQRQTTSLDLDFFPPTNLHPLRHGPDERPQHPR